MKKINLLKTVCAAFAFMLVTQSCLKDTCSRTFTMYLPLYKTTAEVRANIKNDAPQNIVNAGKMFLLGNYIFLNEVDKGIHVIDNSDPSKPNNKYFINIPGNIDVAVKENTLYADLYSDFVAIDISDPSAVKVKKIIDDVFPFRRYTNGFVTDTSKIIVDWIKKDTTVECTTSWVGRPDILFMDAAQFSSASSSSSAVTKGIGGSMARFTLLNNYLYTVTNQAINVFDVAEPNVPVFKNKVDIGWSIETIYPFNNNLFIGSATGMLIYGTGNPLQPNRLSTFTHARVCDPVIADDNFAYVTLRSGTRCSGFTNQLDVLDIKNLSSPLLLKSYQLTNPHGLSKSGNLLFICDGKDGLKVFDAANVNDLKPVKTISGFETFDVIADNNLAIVSAKDGLYQYSYQNPNNITFLSKLSIVKN